MRAISVVVPTAVPKVICSPPVRGQKEMRTGEGEEEGGEGGKGGEGGEAR